MKQATILALSALALGFWAAAQAVTPSIMNIRMVGGKPQLRIEGELGFTNQIQCKTDLGEANWLPLTNLLVGQSPYTFVDVSAPPGQPRFYRVLAWTNSTSPPPGGMVLIPAGAFTMGDTFGEGRDNELPLHTVSVSAIYMDANLVGYELWQQVHGWAVAHGYSFDHAGLGKAASHPVVVVDWYDVVKWCNARSEMEGRTPAYYTSAAQTTVYRTGQVDVDNAWVKWTAGYRLPTEAEWEKAARGGVSGQRFPWGDTISWEQANYSGWPVSAGGTWPYDLSPAWGFDPQFADGVFPYTSPVGFFAPNGYGLYDMAGNVYQWCWDWQGDYSSDSQADPRGPGPTGWRILRSAGWDNGAFFCRAAFRGGEVPGNCADHYGFHSVLPADQL